MIGVLAGRALPPGTERWSSLLDRNRAFLDGVDFRGDPGQVVRLPATDDIDMESVLLVGLGPTADNEALRRAAGWAARSAGGAVAVVTDLHTAGTEGAVRAVTEGFLLGSYRFDRYRSRPNRRRRPVSCSPGRWRPTRRVEAGKLSPRRWLWRATWSSSRQPPNLPMTWRLGLPRSQLRREQASRSSGEQIAAAGLGGLASTAGSTRPRAWSESGTGRTGQSGRSSRKGITFDSGGLSIKTAEQMEPMKSDMAGAAAVVALQAVAKLGLLLRSRSSPRWPTTSRRGRR